MRAQDDGGDTVLLIRSPEDTALGEALVKELQVLGYEVVTKHKAPDPRPFSDFTSLAQRLEIVGAIRIMQDPSVEIWATDDGARITVKRVHSRTGEDACIEAVSIVELLRACLLESSSGPGTADPLAKTTTHFEATAPPQTQEDEDPGADLDVANSTETAPVPTPWVPQANPRLFLDGSLAVTMGNFETKPVTQVALGAHFRVKGIWGVEALGMLPGATIQVDSEYGKVRYRNGAGLLGVRLTFGPVLRVIWPYVSAGGGIGISKITSSAKDYLDTEDSTVLGFMPYGSLGLRFGVNDLVRLNVGVLLSLSLPSVNVYVMNENRFSWGPLILAPNVGLGLGFIVEK